MYQTLFFNHHFIDAEIETQSWSEVNVAELGSDRARIWTNAVCKQQIISYGNSFETWILDDYVVGLIWSFCIILELPPHLSLLKKV